MELKTGMQLYDKKHNIVLTIVDVDIDKICVCSKAFVDDRELSLSAKFIQDGLEDGSFKVVLNRKNNYW